MKDKIICEGQKNKSFLGVIISIASILLLIAIICLSMFYDEKSYWPNLSYTGSGEFMTGIIMGPIAFIALVFALILSKSGISVTENRVFGRTIFGKQIDLPISQISSVGLSLLSSIVVASSSGKVGFAFIKNRKELYDTISNLLIKRQEETKTATNNIVMPQSSAGELKRYKDLLDSGVITQEEFDAKKKQLLDL